MRNRQIFWHVRIIKFIMLINCIFDFFNYSANTAVELNKLFIEIIPIIFLVIFVNNTKRPSIIRFFVFSDRINAISMPLPQGNPSAAPLSYVNKISKLWFIGQDIIIWRISLNCLFVFSKEKEISADKSSLLSN